MSLDSLFRCQVQLFVYCACIVFNPVAPYGYLLSDMYLFMADITNPDLFA